MKERYVKLIDGFQVEECGKSNNKHEQ